MKLSRQTSTIGSKKKPTDAHSTGPLLPHEVDQEPKSQEEEEPRHVGKQGYHDIRRGLKDTDRWGGEDYQRSTQNDAIANTNSARRRGSKRR
ncbi:hypothetical protein [Paraburkholderia sacchari]|uniref:Uncharacterized protein n=1 Tax=Paraburkholderia sacchari TaxID=159450 RepID=A0A8T6Z6C8_9BURK|nr:hypothetical protein [Paraburkholderia sacchari]NLP60262.1 hypothetical protein [Paraburkholderia sacchari]